MPRRSFLIVISLLALSVAAAEEGKDQKATDITTSMVGPNGSAGAAAYNASRPETKLTAAAVGEGGAGDAEDAIEVPVVLPEHPTDEQDAYLCTSVQLPDRPFKLVGISPNSDQQVVHHMLLFGCKAPADSSKVWDCRMASACADSGSENVLYGWGKNAPAMAVPEGAGFSVGPGTSIRTVVLQIHYLNGRPANDTSGLTLHLSPREIPHSAGMVAFASTFTIPARTPETLVENSCCYSGWEPLHGFATRVHTHALGREVYLDRWADGGASEPNRVVSLDPQQPQGFYPVKPEATVLPGDYLGMACRFNSSAVKHDVSAGSTHADEMCNLYLMLYSQLPVFMWCLDGREWVELDGAGGLPIGSKLQPETHVWQPPTVLQINGAAGGKQGIAKAGKEGSSAAAYPLGQVPGVASIGDGSVWVFHRGDHAWNTDGSIGSTSINSETEFLLQGPVVLQLDQDSGQVLRSWGAGKFFLPHMITVDWDGYIWVTDLGLHQALKFSPEGEQLLALGTPFQPGSGHNMFCQPTQVAVARSGNIFVADGYCSSRVAEFNSSGAWLRDYQLPQAGERQMEVPHSVVVHECRKQLLVADREGGRVHAFQLGTAKYLGHWDLGTKFGLPYALALGPYGSVLALTWAHRDSRSAKVWLVALSAAVGALGSHWEVPGVEVPHDLALAPAPLELTGAGERLMAVVVSETKESKGSNLHKFVFTPPDVRLNSDRGERDDDVDALRAQLSSAAQSHSGHAHAHAHGDGAAGSQQQQQQRKEGEEEQEGEEKQPAGMHASHIGHVMLKPVDGGSAGDAAKAAASSSKSSDASAGKQQQASSSSSSDSSRAGGALRNDEEGDVEEYGQASQHAKQPASGVSGKGAEEEGRETATHIGHTMVKPVEASGEITDKELSGQAATATKIAGAPEVAADAPAGKASIVSGKAAAARAAAEQLKQQHSENKQTHGGEIEDATKEKDERQQQQAEKQKEQEENRGDGAGTSAEEAADAADDQGVAEEKELAGEVEKSVAAALRQAEGEEDEGVSTDAAATTGEAAGEHWHPKHEQHVPGRSFAQPSVLGVVFVGAALVSWNRLQHWRMRGGAGYHPSSHGHVV